MGSAVYFSSKVFTENLGTGTRPAGVRLGDQVRAEGGVSREDTRAEERPPGQGRAWARLGASVMLSLVEGWGQVGVVGAQRGDRQRKNAWAQGTEGVNSRQRGSGPGHPQNGAGPKWEPSHLEARCCLVPSLSCCPFTFHSRGTSPLCQGMSWHWARGAWAARWPLAHRVPSLPSCPLGCPHTSCPERT